MDGEITGTIVPAPAGGLTPLAATAAADAMPESTRRAYKAAWEEFSAWCAGHGRTAMPADADTLASYAAWLCYERPVLDRGGLPTGKTGLSPATVNQRLAAIATAHKLADRPAPQPARARLIVAGYKDRLARSRDPRSRPRKAVPFSRGILEALTGPGLRGAQDAIRLRDTAMFYLDFAAATRVSELVSVNIEDVRREDGRYVVSIYRGKNRKHTDVQIPRVDAPSICGALDAWLEFLAGRGITEGPLFPRVDKAGRIGAQVPGVSGDGRLSVRKAAGRVQLAREEAGLGSLKLTPHSGRRGFVTEATLAGHGLIAIEHQGGWAPGSTSVKGYFDEAAASQLNPLRGVGF